MFPFRVILFAADYSEPSKEVFRVACSLANESDTKVIVLHVIEPVPSAGYPMAFGEMGALTYLISEGLPRDEITIGRLRDTYAPGRPLDVDYLVRHGVPAEQILRAAEDVRADLIALGTEGLTGLPRIMMGSVAEAVLRRAGRPVLVMRAGTHMAKPGQEPRRILHPTDFSEESRAALSVARQLARDLGIGLVLLHVLPAGRKVPGVVPSTVDVTATRDALDLMQRLTDGPDLKSPIQTALRQGETAAEILHGAEAAECDLIVMGTHGRTGLRRLLLGSVAEAVLHRASCPVISVKTAAVMAEQELGMASVEAR